MLLLVVANSDFNSASVLSTSLTFTQWLYSVMSSRIVDLLSLIVMRRNGATLDRKTLEAAELSLKSKRRYERFGPMNELRKDGTEKIILLFPSAVHGSHARRREEGVTSGLDAINHGHHFARD